MNKIKEFLRKGNTFLTKTIVIIINLLLLTIAYILGVGIISIIAKLLRKQFLDMKMSKETKTYWKDLYIRKKPIDEYYRQF